MWGFLGEFHGGGGLPLTREEPTDPSSSPARSAAIEELKKDPTTHPYPHKFHVDVSLQEFIQR